MVEIKRATKETDICLKLNIDGSGKYKIDTKIGFFNHMLESFAKHSFFDIELRCDGDIDVDFHHSVEDVGIVLGEALKKSIYPLKNRERFGQALIVMDESAVESALDLSNRPYLVYDMDLDGKIGNFDAELIEEFFRAFVFNAKITAHIIKRRGKNRHHLAEAAFKSLAVALRRALKTDPKASIPSTKGMI